VTAAGGPYPGHSQLDLGPEELAAIVAAVEMAWPRPVIMSPPPGADRPGPWRFSGRWWSKPSAVQRNRPWVDRVS
jgi:hypothetical protein